MKKLLLFLSAWLLLLSGPSLAASREDLAREMLRLTDTRQMMDQIIAQIQQLQAAQLEDLHIPEAERARVQEFQQLANQKIFAALSWEKLEPDYIQLFARFYTTEELEAIIAFCKSPAGQSMLKKQPLLMQESMLLAQQKLATILPEIEAMTEDFLHSLHR